MEVYIIARTALVVCTLSYLPLCKFYMKNERSVLMHNNPPMTA
jgi:hypothetical protein